MSLVGLDDAHKEVGDANGDLRICGDVEDEPFSRGRRQADLQRATITGEVGRDPLRCTAPSEHAAGYCREVVEQRGARRTRRAPLACGDDLPTLAGHRLGGAGVAARAVRQ